MGHGALHLISSTLLSQPARSPCSWSPISEGLHLHASRTWCRPLPVPGMPSSALDIQTQIPDLKPLGQISNFFRL